MSAVNQPAHKTHRLTLKQIQTDATAKPESVTVLLPVLNESLRLADCLAGLTAQTEEVKEIVVIDGGSADGTQAIVEDFRRKDQRIRLLDATPIDPHWTGKAWGLYVGLQYSDARWPWILCVDADIRLAPLLVRSLLGHAQKTGVSSYSVATAQRLPGRLAGLIHPPMLTSLVYRFGPPGYATQKISRVQANGQCFLSRRETLLRTQALNAARASLCEDVTMARRLAECGETVGFYEARPGLITVGMYATAKETWDNWPRSLPLRDRYFGWRQGFGLCAALMLQALPLPVLMVAVGTSAPRPFLLIAGSLLALRIGVLIGTARAYPARPWTYWLSLIGDLPVALRILQFALRRRQSWRGRRYIRQRGGRFEPMHERNA
ncbi:MAG TPA: glycosyltransferase family 2 protein [Candidatus Binatia bacterium]|jgi:dolichol-phosphate mannosyltransferase